MTESDVPTVETAVEAPATDARGSLRVADPEGVLDRSFHAE